MTRLERAHRHRRDRYRPVLLHDLPRDGSAPNLERVWEHAILPLLEEHYYGTSWPEMSVRSSH